MSMIETKRVVFEPHPHDEWYDTCTVTCVERWKESEMSGDEWRFAYHVSFMRKGFVLAVRSYSRFPWAMAHVPADALNDYPGGADEEHQDCPAITHRFEFCFQPGCCRAATREFRMLRLYDRSGSEQQMSKDSDHRRRFCDKHARSRGDCGLSDADTNYVEVEFGSPAGAPAVPFKMEPVYHWEPGRGAWFACPHPECAPGAFVWELPDTGPASRRIAREDGIAVWRAHMRSDHGFSMLVGEIPEWEGPSS